MMDVTDEIEAIETILSEVNLFLDEFGDREIDAKQHNANTQAYINILEGMKNKLIEMIHTYEDEEILLFRLLELNDDIDQSVSRLTTELTAQTIEAMEINTTVSSTCYEVEIYEDIMTESSDGASSSSSQTRKKKEKEEITVDKKGKMAAKVTCNICDEEYDSWDLVHELESCEHIYCIECLQQYFTQKIKDGSVLNISCPDPTCKSEVVPSDVRAVLDSAAWEKFENFTLTSALKRDPNYCWCPYPGCENVFYREQNEDRKVMCDVCGYQFCAECKGAWHGDISCEEYASAKKLQKSRHVKPCPKCYAYIEKIGGCNHMTCSSCRHQFCWLCLSQYTLKHFNDKDNFPHCYLKQFYTPRPWYVKAGRTVGIGAAVVVLGVPALVIGGPIYGGYKLHQRWKRKRWYR